MPPTKNLEEPVSRDLADWPQPPTPTESRDQERFDGEVSTFSQAAGIIGGFVGVLALIVAAIALALGTGSGETTTVVKQAAATAPTQAGYAVGHPTLAESKGVAFEPYEFVDPTLPDVPAGAVKKFTVDVMQHVTQVHPDLAPTEAWTYVINGKTYRGTAASAPIVVNEGDRVEAKFVNGGSKAMAVNMPHSIDFHSAEVAPNKNYIDIGAGKSLTISFTAKHPGVYMVHCATQPVLLHTSNGMSFMMVVKPKGLAPVDRELWITQSEYYLGAPGKIADADKMAAQTPDAMAFNGYASQYKANPIKVNAHERIRMWVLNAGPSKWSAFHVIGTVFDKAVVENTAFPDSQTMNLAPSQGGYAEFTLDHEGNYPFVTHAFGDMTKGAAGILQTAGAPAPKTAAAPKPGAAKADVNIKLGEMYIKSDKPAIKAGKVSFAVANEGEAIHGLAIMKAPAKITDGLLDHGAMLAVGKELGAGESEIVTGELKPGSYELVCFIPGHYMSGQKLAFKVTS